MFSRIRQALPTLGKGDLIEMGGLNIRIKCQLPQATQKAEEPIKVCFALPARSCTFSQTNLDNLHLYVVSAESRSL